MRWDPPLQEWLKIAIFSMHTYEHAHRHTG
jgi:hypothetical protein